MRAGRFRIGCLPRGSSKKTEIPPNGITVTNRNLNTPHRVCSGCGFTCYKDEYLASQWNRKDKHSWCKICVKRKAFAGTPLECSVCSVWKAEVAFAQQQQDKRGGERECVDCIETRKCKKCGEQKPLQAGPDDGNVDSFSLSEWEMQKRLLRSEVFARGVSGATK